MAHGTTVIYGGIGTSGPYLTELIDFLNEHGVDAPRIGNKTLLGGDEVVDKGLQIAGIPWFRGCRRRSAGAWVDGLDDTAGSLIGYSWGGLVATQVALSLSKVERLVLIATPISRNLLDTAMHASGIGTVHILDLTEAGDPLYAGISFDRLLAAILLLIRQYGTLTGHFLYAAPGPEGQAARRDLAERLVSLGVT